MTRLRTFIFLTTVPFLVKGDEDFAACRDGGWTLNISEEIRNQWFHPVIQFPRTWRENDEEEDTMEFSKKNENPSNENAKWWNWLWKKNVKKRRRRRDQLKANYQLLNLTDTTGQSSLIPPHQWSDYRRHQKTSTKSKQQFYTVGRYNENRPHLYSSDMFHNESYAIDGYSNQRRTVHMGIDLGAPVGTKVHAFTGGIVHSAGYNPELGDYGYVVVIQHVLPTPLIRRSDHNDKNSSCGKLWALYGHLSSRAIHRMVPGRTMIRRGQVIGYIGDVHECGGWSSPHVHFQLSIKPPQTHDMPGVVSVPDQCRALLDYPDPRIVLGPLYTD